MQSSPRKENSKRRKKIEKKSKDVHFPTEYIFLKPKDQTNEHEQKNK